MFEGLQKIEDVLEHIEENITSEFGIDKDICPL